jgi:hypothetical protein
MKTTINSVVAPLALVVGLVAGCAAETHNPPTLWLALDGAETKVTLIDHDPPPF